MKFLVGVLQRSDYINSKEVIWDGCACCVDLIIHTNCDLWEETFEYVKNQPRRRSGECKHMERKKGSKPECG